ncbi:MAG: DUF1385 domain-containing protein [Candidatus Krumholzibacteriia bacterium]
MQSQPAKIPPFTIGGQAVIEGVMMRSPSAVATAVRKASGEIEVTHRPFRGITSKVRPLNLPILRGGVNLIETLYLGMQALSYSAEQAMEEEKRREAATKDWKSTLVLVLPMVIAFAAGIGLFFYVPLLLTEWTGIRGGIAFNLVDGVFRLLIFLAYIWGISRWKEMGRVFQYHGAEHKSIFVFEAGLPLVPEYSKRFTTFHPRCGTSFLLLVMLTSIVVFSFLGRPEDVGERLLRLAFIPVIGGVAYELIKLSARPNWQRWMQPIILPGLWLQKITTNEPSLDQVEVAMEAAKACLAYDGQEVESPELAVQAAGA